MSEDVREPEKTSSESKLENAAQDIQEIRHKKWLESKKEEAANATNEEPSRLPVSSSSLAPPNTSSTGSVIASSGQDTQEVPPLKRVHILPLPDVDPDKLGGKTRLEFLAPALRKKRADKEILATGHLIRHENAEFVVIKCEPEAGPLGTDTDYFLDGSPLVFFEKIQFSGWGPNELTADVLFAESITPLFKDEYAPYGSERVAKRLRIFSKNEVLKASGDVMVQVEATEPPDRLGIVTNNTEIFTNWDASPDFDKIHIVPFQDTLPRAAVSSYGYDVFSDYLRPYLLANKYRKFQNGDIFTWNGVQFKVVACDPDARGRIGNNTTIYCEGTLHPNLRNLLPPELQAQVERLPPGLQMLLLTQERTTRELEDMLAQRRGLFPETIERIPKFNWPPEEQPVNQHQCMVCLTDFVNGDECRRLPCNHVFHVECIDEWLCRCTDCPICKTNVDRVIRNY